MLNDSLLKVHQPDNFTIVSPTAGPFVTFHSVFIHIMPCIYLQILYDSPYAHNS